MATSDPMNDLPSAAKALLDALDSPIKYAGARSYEREAKDALRLALSQPPALPGREEIARAEPPSTAGLHWRSEQLVENFTDALAEKLTRAQEKYGFTDGWAHPGWQDECVAHLAEHLQKGEPLDVATYAAFCWYHGWPTTPAIHPARAEEWRAISEAPKDGTPFVIGAAGWPVQIAHYSTHRRWFDLPAGGRGCEETHNLFRHTYAGAQRYEPTHFRPLPPPPKPEVEG